MSNKNSRMRGMVIVYFKLLHQKMFGAKKKKNKKKKSDYLNMNSIWWQQTVFVNRKEKKQVNIMQNVHFINIFSQWIEFIWLQSAVVYEPTFFFLFCYFVCFFVDFILQIVYVTSDFGTSLIVASTIVIVFRLLIYELRWCRQKNWLNPIRVSFMIYFTFCSVVVYFFLFFGCHEFGNFNRK